MRYSNQIIFLIALISLSSLTEITRRGTVLFKLSKKKYGAQALYKQLQWHHDSLIFDWEPVKQYRKYFYGESDYMKVFDKSLKQTKDLYYSANVYTLPLLVGSVQTELDVMIDTASDYLVVVGPECDCTSEAYFNPELSTSYRELSDDVITQEFESTTIEGLEVQDDVFIDDEIGVELFPFLLAVDAEGMEGLSGVCGFARNIKTELVENEYYYPGPLYYNYLKSAGVIDSSVFSLYLSESGSTLELGGSSLKSYTQGDSVEIEAERSMFWQTTVQGIKVGEQDSSQQWALANFSAIFDSGTPFVYTPYSIGNLVWDYAFDLVKYRNVDGLIKVDCDVDFEKVKTVSLLIDEQWFDIPPYIVEIDTDDCVFGIVQGGGEYFLLGEAFLRNYYTSYDNDLETITIAPAKGAAVEEIYDGEIPDREYTGLKKSDVIMIIGIVAAVVLVIIIILIVLAVTGVFSTRRNWYNDFDFSSK